MKISDFKPKLTVAVTDKLSVSVTIRYPSADEIVAYKQEEQERAKAAIERQRPLIMAAADKEIALARHRRELGLGQDASPAPKKPRGMIGVPAAVEETLAGDPVATAEAGMHQSLNDILDITLRKNDEETASQLRNIKDVMEYVARYVTWWNLDLDDGTMLPVTVEAMQAQPLYPVYEAIMRAIQKEHRLGEEPQNEQKSP